jgi:Ubiquitin carboxyl-terminal hydrolase 47 C-terminal
LQNQVVEHLERENCAGEWNADLLRVREKSGTRLARILLPYKLLSSYFSTLRDGIELVLQRLSAPEQLRETSLLLGVRHWRPVDWELDEYAQERVFEHGQTIASVREQLAELVGVDVAHVGLSKLPPKLDPYAIATGNWDPQEDRTLGGSPWYLKTGDVIVWKDVRDANKHDVSGMKSSSYGDGRVGGGGPGLSIEFYSAALEQQEEDALARILKESEETARREEEARQQ